MVLALAGHAQSKSALVQELVTFDASFAQLLCTQLPQPALVTP
jgi:hypothetical protein